MTVSSLSLVKQKLVLLFFQEHMGVKYTATPACQECSGGSHRQGRVCPVQEKQQQGCVLCLHVPCAHPSPVTPRVKVSETLFFLPVVTGGCSQNVGATLGVSKGLWVSETEPAIVAASL